MRRMLVPALLLLAVACRAEQTRPAVPLGENRLAVPGGTMWYKVSGTDSATPVVILHGGPGFSSFYLKSLEALGDERLVVRYDQLGSGKSDTTSDTTLFTIPHFVAQLDSLRAFLGIPRWHVYGHSWGTMLALEYYRAHPDRVVSLAFGSPVFDAAAFEANARKLIATLSDSAQRAIRRAEAAGRFDTPAYEHAVNEFYGLYVFRNPVPADLDSTFATYNPALYGYMWGPSEFTVSGTLKTFNGLAHLPTITVPALMTVGEFDEVGPEIVKQHADMVPGARYALIPGAAHITSWDAAEENTRVVREFLRTAEPTSRRAN